MNRPVLLYDGYCRLCSGAVQFVLKHERGPQILFCALQSPAGQQLLRQYQLPVPDPQTLAFIVNGRCTTGYRAVAEVTSYLRFPWSAFRMIRLLPAFIGVNAYRLLARNRNRIFGKTEQCMVSLPGAENRFMEHLPPGD